MSYSKTSSILLLARNTSRFMIALSWLLSTSEGLWINFVLKLLATDLFDPVLGLSGKFYFFGTFKKFMKYRIITRSHLMFLRVFLRVMSIFLS